jgi:uncharacterized membrane protein
MTRPDDVALYGTAVRAALADLSPDEREELLEDLEDHLAEVAAEPGASLTDRLGDPQQYASELRAAYGARARSRRRRLLPRRRRARVLAAALVVLVGMGAWLGWRSTQAPARPSWSQAQLLAAARAGKVKSVDITGSTAVATGRDGRQHEVRLPANTDGLASALSQADVNVSIYASQGQLNVHWWFLVVSIASLIFVVALWALVVGSVVVGGLYVLRRLRPARPS